MSVIAVKMKLMPTSPEVDLEEIKKLVAELIENNEGKNPRFEEEPVAFGLKALILTFAWPETKELELFENQLREVENINSLETVDIRRAVG